MDMTVRQAIAFFEGSKQCEKFKEYAESEDEEAKTAANNAKAAIEDTLASLVIKLQKAHALVEGEEYVEPTTEYTESTEATDASEVTEASESTESNEEGSSEP